jgi:HD superfamily phosphodiesterase
MGRPLIVVHTGQEYLDESKTGRDSAILNKILFPRIATEVAERTAKGDLIICLNTSADQPIAQVISECLQQCVLVNLDSSAEVQFLVCKELLLKHGITEVDIVGINRLLCVRNLEKVLQGFDTEEDLYCIVQRSKAEYQAIATASLGWSKAKFNQIFDHPIAAQVIEKLTDIPLVELSDTEMECIAYAVIEMREEFRARIDEIALKQIETENKIKDAIKETFANEPWVDAFLADRHHGFKHGNQVRIACIRMEEKLNSAEKAELLKEGKKICDNNFYQFALDALEIAALFHDCGRFNDHGQIVAEEQKDHHRLSANRAIKFCESKCLQCLIPFVEEAILCHDFQSRELTPDLNPPQTIIGKIVQAADQMCWFHPDSVHRTLEYNKTLGIPFYNANISLQERLEWKPNITSKDALTVMLHQIIGPTGTDRFGIEYARQKVENYRTALEENILACAENFDCRAETEALIAEFKKTK